MIDFNGTSQCDFDFFVTKGHVHWGKTVALRFVPTSIPRFLNDGGF